MNRNVILAEKAIVPGFWHNSARQARNYRFLCRRGYPMTFLGFKGFILKCFSGYKYELVRDKAFHKAVLHQTTYDRLIRGSLL
jgi:hypothetical protein